MILSLDMLVLTKKMFFIWIKKHLYVNYKFYNGFANAVSISNIFIWSLRKLQKDINMLADVFYKKIKVYQRKNKLNLIKIVQFTENCNFIIDRVVNRWQHPLFDKNLNLRSNFWRIFCWDFSLSLFLNNNFFL